MYQVWIEDDVLDIMASDYEVDEEGYLVFWTEDDTGTLQETGRFPAGFWHGVLEAPDEWVDGDGGSTVDEDVDNPISDGVVVPFARSA